MATVLFDQRSDGVALITLNRPQSLNSMGEDMLPRLAEILTACAADPEIRCVALTGAGRAFCAGGDVKRMQRRATAADAEAVARTSFEEDLQALRDRQNGASLQLHSMPKPTVALVNGHAVGAGMSIALACDIRICSDRAKFGTAFRNVGFSGDYGGSYLLQRLVGAGIARELYFSGEIIDAERALALGIANRVVPATELISEGLAFCTSLALGPTRALARMKANLNLAERASLQEVLDQEALNMRLSGQDEEHRQAVQAFVEKRKPQFRAD